MRATTLPVAAVAAGLAASARGRAGLGVPAPHVAPRTGDTWQLGTSRALTGGSEVRRTPLR